MKKLTILALLLSMNSMATAHMMNGNMGMGSSANDQQTSPPPAKSATKPSTDRQTGYDETQAFCSQCHKIPSPDQHTLKEWPKVVERMEGYMMKKRMFLPESSQVELILKYLDNSKAGHQGK